MLVLHGLEKTYGGQRVLAGADLVVSPGEAIALVGGNGSGKTTTLRCIVGLARPDSGSVHIDGIDALAHPREALERVSYLPQKPSFPGTLTVREIVGVVARLRHQPARVVDREIERCGLAPVAGRCVAQLSGGERQRVGLAVTFVADVPVFIFDEPSASLDPVATRILIERARALRLEGRAILYTTHVAADIDELATRVALLRHGRVEMRDDPQLRGTPVGPVRPATPGERALQQLEMDQGDATGAPDERRVWERVARTARPAVGHAVTAFRTDAAASRSGGALGWTDAVRELDTP
jgi:ABC-type multidrug transport system ATPase subunit